jgi:hypothetical protein
MKAPRSVLCALACLAGAAVAQGPGPSGVASKAYDDAIRGKTGGPQIGFGHDVDVQGKAWDFVLTLADKAKLPWDSVDKAKGALLNAIDLRESTRDSGLTAEELNRFAVKTLLDNLSPKEVVRVKRLLGLDNKTTKIIVDSGVGLLEGGAQAAGEAREGDIGAVDTALLTAVDAFCPECSVARRGALLAFEAAKSLEAWAEDEATRKQYDTWKDGGLLLTTKGFGPTMSAARKALTALNESKGRKTPPTTAEVEQFVKSQFESWNQNEADSGREARLLEEVKDDYLQLSDGDRRAFGGKTEQEHAARFADSFLSIYQQMMAAKGGQDLPPGGQERLLQDAARLAHVRASDGDGTYRDRMFDTLRDYGWIPAVSAERRNAIKDRLVQRLPRLSYENLKALFDFAQLNGSEAFYGCLCGRLPGVGIGKTYAPGPGGPCHLFGLGDWREGFPTDPKAWGSCLVETRVGDRSFCDYVADRIIHWTAVK